MTGKLKITNVRIKNMKWQSLLLGMMTLAVLGLFTTQADAHVQKKTWILQGNVSFSSSSGDLYGDDSRTEINLAPTVHYSIMDKFAVGGVMNVGSTRQGDVSSSSLAIGPSARYFFGGDKEKHMGSINPYVGGAILLRSESFDDGNPNTNEESQSGSTIQLAGGLAFYLSNTVALTPELSINLDSMEGESGTTIMLGVGLAGFLPQK